MFRSKSNFNSGLQAFAGAFLLALMIASSLGITRVYAARSTTHAAEMALLGGSNSCAAEMHTSDYYLRQEETVLKIVTQGNWNAVQMALPSSSNLCAVEMHTSDYYLLQEEAVLRIVTQSNWNAAEIASFGGDNFIAQASR